MRHIKTLNEMFSFIGLSLFAMTTYTNAQSVLDKLDHRKGLPTSNQAQHGADKDKKKPTFIIGGSEHHVYSDLSSSFGYDSNITENSLEKDGYYWSNKLSISSKLQFTDSSFSLAPSMTLTDIRHEHLSNLDNNTFGFNLSFAKELSKDLKQGSLVSALDLGSIWVYSTTYDDKLVSFLPITLSLSKTVPFKSGTWNTTLSGTNVMSNPNQLDNWSIDFNTSYSKQMNDKWLMSVAASTGYKEYDEYILEGTNDRKGLNYGASMSISYIFNSSSSFILAANYQLSSNDNDNFDFHRLMVGPALNITW